MRRGLLKKWPRAARLAGDSSLGCWALVRREPLSVRWERLLPCRLPEASVPRRRGPRARSIRSTVNTRQESSHPRRIARTLGRLMAVQGSTARGLWRYSPTGPPPPHAWPRARRSPKVEPWAVLITRHLTTPARRRALSPPGLRLPSGLVPACLWMPRAPTDSAWHLAARRNCRYSRGFRGVPRNPNCLVEIFAFRRVRMTRRLLSTRSGISAGSLSGVQACDGRSWDSGARHPRQRHR